MNAEWTERVWKAAERQQRSILDSLREQAYGDADHEQEFIEAPTISRRLVEEGKPTPGIRHRLRHTGRPYR